MADWTERLFIDRPGAISITCQGCGVALFIPPSKIGQRAYCSTTCKDAHPGERVEAWAKRIWEKRPGTVEKVCESCGRTMHLPPSKTSRRFCTLKCRAEDVQRKLTKQCEACGETYQAWNLGQRYCSHKCNAKSGHLSSPENLAAAQEGRRKAIAEGRMVFRSGPDNPQWKGGPEALARRQQESGKKTAWLRRYRKQNPDKVREFARRRADRKLGKLPYGALIAIRRLQKDRCAICRVKLKGGGHLDHVMPLAKGGRHERSNLQFLCGPCNLRKSDRDPIDHMQSLGRLL